MRRLLSAVVFTACMVLHPVISQAAWVEAKSDNFVFIGDTSEKKAQKIVEELEKYRSIIFTLYNIDVEDELSPIRIYGARSDRDIANMAGWEGASGVYSTRREGAIFILNVKGGFTNKSPAKAIAMHEYTHHLISQYTDQMYPRWVNEGMAEYLSTFSISKKGTVNIGVPKEGRGRTLAAYDWIDWDILTGSIRRYPFGSGGGRKTETIRYLFYAQSWLAVHYMQSTPGMSQKLNKYIKGVPQATSSKAYFEEVFGQTPDAFGKTLKAYYKSNRYMSQRVNLADALDDVVVTVRKLDKGEAEFHRGEAIRQFRADEEEGRALAEKYYTRSEAAGGPMAQIEASRAYLAIAAGTPDVAFAHIETAKAQAPNDSRVIHMAAKVTFAQYQDKSTVSTLDQLDQARDQFVAAMKADPDNMEAHFDYVMTYAATGDSPSKQAVYSAKEATLHYRSPNFLGDNMRLVQVLLKGDELDYAKFHIQRASLWGHNASVRNSAKRMLDRLQ